MIATLTLDDNDFFDLSLPSVTNRDVAADAVADATMYPAERRGLRPLRLGHGLRLLRLGSARADER
jgi:hypothetical protein